MEQKGDKTGESFIHILPGQCEKNPTLFLFDLTCDIALEAANPFYF